MRLSVFTRLISLVCLLGAASPEVFAACTGSNFIWTGSTDSDWGTPSNWDLNSSYPGSTCSADTALFDSTGLIRVVNIADFAATTPNLTTLTFQDNYTLNVSYIGSLTTPSPSTVPSTVQAGTLVLGDGSHPGTFLNGDLQVNAGATLNGLGTVKNLDNYGTVAPGVPGITPAIFNVGTFSTGGKFTAEPGSFLRIRLLEYNPPISISTNDTLHVNGAGSTTLLPGSNLVIDPSHGQFFIDFPYTVLETAGNNLTGTFNLIQPSAFDGSLSYDYFPSFGSVTYTINGFTAAVPNGGATHANQQLALAQLSNWFDSAMRDRIIGYAGDKEGGKIDPTVWLTTASETHKLSDKGNGFKASPKDVALGLEKSTSDTLLGLGLAYTHFSSEGFFVDERSRSKGNLYQLGSYGSQDRGNWRLGGNTALGITNDIDTERDVDMGIDSATVTGKHKAHRLSVETQASYLGLHTYNNTAALQPLVGLGYQWLGSNHFNEQGETTLELDVSHANYYSLNSRLGFALEANSEGIHPFALAAWEHEFANRASKVTVAVQPEGETFPDTNGTPINREVFATKLGLSAMLKQVHFTAFYEGRHTNHYHENSGRLQASYSAL